jgi:MFS superfamily sulfate permease-like transporter
MPVLVATVSRRQRHRPDDPAQWFGNIRDDVLAGVVVALALIQAATAFSIIAGVDPKVGLCASFSIVVRIGLVGRRPGMILAETAEVTKGLADARPMIRASKIPALFMR